MYSIASYFFIPNPEASKWLFKAPPWAILPASYPSIAADREHEHNNFILWLMASFFTDIAATYSYQGG